MTEMSKTNARLKTRSIFLIIGLIAQVLMLGVKVPVASAQTTSFTDSFEAASFDSFWTLVQDFGTITLSSDLAHLGNQSVRMSSTGGGQRTLMLTHSFPEAGKGSVSVWLYDTAAGAETLYADLSSINSASAASGTPGYAFVVGVRDWDAYWYHVGVGGIGEVTTEAARTVGWHELRLVYNPSDVQAFIDGSLVSSTPGDYSFDKVSFSVSGPSTRPDATYYFDDFSLDLPLRPITVSIAAEVALVDDTSNILGGAINVGDILTGSYTYESTTLDSNVLPTVGDYWHSSPPYGITVRGGGLVFETDPGNVRFLVEIVNDHGVPVRDNYLLRSYNNLPLPGGALVDHISWQLDDPNATALSSESLPTVPPTLSDWQSIFGLTITGSNPSDPFRENYFIRAHVTSAVIAPSPDVDGDGIPDDVELSPEMQALGADPCRKTIAVEIDYLEPLDHSHTHHPGNDAINMVVDAFNRAPVPATMSCPYFGFPRETSGIGLIVDVDEAIPEDENNVALTFNPNGFQPGDTSFDTVKAAHFSLDRVDYFHYNLWVHDLEAGSTTSGIGDFHGNDFIVSLGSWEGGAPTVLQRAGTFMHELGHNLGLHHGGGDGVNFKPNHLSVMSYAFQTVGIRGADGTTRLDYSKAMLPTLDENSLTETGGIGPITDYTSWSCTGKEAELTGLGNSGLDWNCNSSIDLFPIVGDINGDRVCIKPGDNGTLESADMGDDQVVGSQIHDGANRTCESTVSGDDEQKRAAGNVQPNLLEGFEDWNAIDYIFRDNPENYPGHDTIETGHDTIETGKELTFEEAQVIERFWAEFSILQLAESFSSPLKSDSQGNPRVDVILANRVVRSINPGQVIVQTTITNGGGSSISSLRLAQVLPDDWILSPFDQQVRVYFESAEQARVELTTGVSVSVEGSPQTVSLTIPDILATEAGKTLDPGESIIVYVKMDYALKGTRQLPENYPIPYTTAATATVYSGTSYDGTGVQSYQPIVFVAYARVVGG